MAALALLLSAAAAAALGDGSAIVLEFTEREIARIRQHSPIPPAPDDPTNRVQSDPAAARLGQFLFFETRLSSNGRIACATCHDPRTGWSDGKRIAEGIRALDRHTLSVRNAAFSRWLFWDGRADSLWAQAIQPIEHPLEMGSSRAATARLVAGDLRIRDAYSALFGPPGDPGDPREADRVAANVGKAIAAYERLLVSRPAPFDAFVEGLSDRDPAKLAAISPQARRGLKLFVGKADCRRCHLGPLFTDGEFHDTGVRPLSGGTPSDPARMSGAEALLEDPFNARGRFSDDPGGERARRLSFLSVRSEDWGRFKTPSLRDVASSPPYMHQGQLATLRDVVRFYATREGALPPGHHGETVLRPIPLSDIEMDDLVAFLESLTGPEPEPSLARRPSSP